MKNRLLPSLFASLLLGVCAQTLAKLPALTTEAAAKAAEAAAKVTWTSKVDGYLLCKSIDKVSASYYKSAKAAGKETKPAVATPVCIDPGPFIYSAPEAAKPIEAAGAHSPAATAVSPPNGKKPAAEIDQAKKI